jgi:hypothetical protein
VCTTACGRLVEGEPVPAVGVVGALFGHSSIPAGEDAQAA